DRGQRALVGHEFGGAPKGPTTPVETDDGRRDKADKGSLRQTLERLALQRGWKLHDGSFRPTASERGNGPRLGSDQQVGFGGRPPCDGVSVAVTVRAVPRNVDTIRRSTRQLQRVCVEAIKALMCKL